MSAIGCRDNTGGVQNGVYIANYNGNLMSFGMSGSTVTSFTGATTSFYLFAQDAEVVSWTSTFNGSTENATSYYTQTVEMVIPKLSDSVDTLINTLGFGIQRIMLCDKNGVYHLIGAKNGTRITASTPGVGKAMGDLNGVKLTFEAKEPVTAFIVSSAAALSVIS